MAGASQVIGSSRTGIFFKAAALARAGTPPVFTKAAVQAILVDPYVAATGGKVNDATEVGDQEETANTTKYTVYDQDTQKTLSNSTALADFTFAFAVDHTNAGHVALRDMAIGTPMTCVVRLDEAVRAAAKATYVILVGTLAGRSNRTPNSNDPNTMMITVGIDDIDYMDA